MRAKAVTAVLLLMLLLCACANALVRPSFLPRAELDLSGGEISYTFIAAYDGIYDIVFLDNGEEFTLDSAYMTTGRTRLPLSGARLTKNREYTITASGSGSCTLEIMRRSSGLSLLYPLEAAESGASGILSRESSCAWFVIEPFEGLNMLTVSPVSGEGMNLSAALYDGERKLAAVSDATVAGDAIVSFESSGAEKMYLRIWSEDGGRGIYTFRNAYAGEVVPGELTLTREELNMFVGSMRSQRAVLTPEGAEAPLVWRSTDESVVSLSGRVLTAAAPGTAEVYAYSYGGLSAKMRVTVLASEPRDMFYYSDETYIPLGDRLTPRMIIYPSTASTDNIVYSSSDESVAVVSTNGEIAAVGMGMAVVKAVSGDIEAATNVIVTRPTLKFRALIVGEENYAEDVNTKRPGAYNSVAALSNLFGSAAFTSGMDVIVSPMLDLSADELISGAGEFFLNAAEGDVSLLYLTCHGVRLGEKALMQFTDGSTMDADGLYSLFSNVKGTVIIMLDCCSSGAVIGAHDTFASRFEEELSMSPFLSSRFKLLLSASVGQDSYRIGSSGDEDSITTVFARALCDALGYSIDNKSRGPLGADRDLDGKVTLNETFLYVSRRVKQYLSRVSGGGYAQEVIVYPEGDGFVLFER